MTPATNCFLSVQSLRRRQERWRACVLWPKAPYTEYHDKLGRHITAIKYLSGVSNPCLRNGVSRLENAEYKGHRLTVYRSRTGGYRAYIEGRMTACGAANSLP